MRQPQLSLLLLLVPLLACNALAGGPGLTPQPTAAAALAAFSTPQPDQDKQFESLDRLLLADPASLEHAALAALDHPNPDVRFAAAYALANGASSDRGLDALHDLLQSEAVAQRALAAEALLAHGDPSGAPVLIALLSDPEPLPYARPPTAAWQFAQHVLKVYFEHDHGLLAAQDFEAVAAAQPGWLAWWHEVEGSLVWIADEHTFRSAP